MAVIMIKVHNSQRLANRNAPIWIEHEGLFPIRNLPSNFGDDSSLSCPSFLPKQLQKNLWLWRSAPPPSPHTASPATPTAPPPPPPTPSRTRTGALLTLPSDGISRPAMEQRDSKKIEGGGPRSRSHRHCVEHRRLENQMALVVFLLLLPRGLKKERKDQEGMRRGKARGEREG